MSVEIGTDGRHDQGATGLDLNRAQQGVNKLLSLTFVVAQGEYFLELVDNQQQLHVVRLVGKQASDGQVQAAVVGL